MKTLINMALKIVIAVLLCSSIAIAQDSTLCDTGIKIEQRIEVQENGSILVVFNPQSEQIFIIAFDYGSDGIYEVLIFDTDGNGNVDMQLEGGGATAEQVIWLYCGYERIELVSIPDKLMFSNH